MAVRLAQRRILSLLAAKLPQNSLSTGNHLFFFLYVSLLDMLYFLGVCIIYILIEEVQLNILGKKVLLDYGLMD